jgi:hypothetical protein
MTLADEGSDELLVEGTPSERVAMVWALTRSAYAFVDEAPRPYTRATMPGRMLRGLGPG